MSGMEDFFTSGRRIKKSEPTQKAQETGQRRSKETLETKDVPTSTPQRNAQARERSSEFLKAASSLTDEGKRYPERTFDRYIQKGARLRAEDIDLLKVFCSEITRAKRELPYEYRSNKRITDNTILRILVQKFCEQIEGRLDSIDFKGIQTEGELKKFIEETMRF